jgi:3-hydroxyisobutyrate dehydrogenase-like beta-hydroxyacid dehydrogenase
MGTPIAGCLISAGHSLSVYDRRADASTALRAQGAVQATSACAAAHNVDVVFTSLPGPAEFEAAMLEPQVGILAGRDRVPRISISPPMRQRLSPASAKPVGRARSN